jgi:hypothetical protein
VRLPPEVLDAFLIDFYTERVVWFQSCTCVCLVFPATFVEETYLLQHVFGTSDMNLMAVAMWAYFWILCSVGLMCMFLWQYHAVFVTMAL